MLQRMESGFHCGKSCKAARRLAIQSPRSATFCGMWGQLIKSCQKSLIAIMVRRRLTLQVLTLTMCLVKQTLNSRPLTPVSDDAKTREAPITPNQSLLGKPAISEQLFFGSIKL